MSLVSFYGPYCRTPKCFGHICGQTVEQTLSLVGTAELELFVNILNKELLLVLSGHSVPQRCMPDLFAFKVECVCMCASLVLPLCSVSAFRDRSLQRLLENVAS